MILLNFGPKLTDEQWQQIEELWGVIDHEVVIALGCDLEQPLVEQVTRLIASAGLTMEEWVLDEVVVVPPLNGPMAMVLLARLYRQMGQFPPIVHLRPEWCGTAPRPVVAEVIDLEDVAFEVPFEAALPLSCEGS